MKKRNENFAKIFWGVHLKLTEKCNAVLAKTQKCGEKFTEKRKAVFVFYLVGFLLNLTEKCNENFGKDRFTLDLTKPIFVVTLG